MDDSTTKLYIDLENSINEMKIKQEDLKNKILNEMKNKNIVKLENDYLKITYIEETERESFDTKKLKEEQPDLYNSYIKFSNVKESIRIKVKNDR